MCRILYLLGQLRAGGQERQLYYLLKAMNRAIYQPAIAVWNYTTRDERYVEQLRRLEVPVYACSDGVSHVAKIAEIQRLAVRLRPEVIHSYCFYMNFVAWASGVYSKAIPIGSIRQDFVSERWRVGGARGIIIGCMSATLPSFQICNSWTAKHAAEESKRIFKPRHMYVVPNGVDVEPIDFSAPVTGGTLLAIGRLERDKRWDRLLKALAVLRNNKVEFSLRLVGDGPLRNQLQFQARQLGLEGCVHFLGLRHDIFDLLQQSSFLIHTADAEGCPNVVLEAMAAARAVVATDAGDVPRLIENGKSGFVVRRGNDEELAHRIAALITDLDLCCAMGKAGRAKAEREFSLDQLRLNTLSAYRAAGWQDGLTVDCVSDSNTPSAAQNI